MNEIIERGEINIENMIYEIRGSDYKMTWLYL